MLLPENEDQALLCCLPGKTDTSLNSLCQASGTRFAVRVGQVAETPACLSAVCIRLASWHSIVSLREQGEFKLRSLETRKVRSPFCSRS